MPFQQLGQLKAPILPAQDNGRRLHQCRSAKIKHWQTQGTEKDATKDSC